MRYFSGKVVQFCPYFSVAEDILCSAWDSQQYVPNDFQQRDYCTSNGHRTCPRFTAVDLHAENEAVIAMSKSR